MSETLASVALTPELIRVRRLDTLRVLYEDFGDRIYAHCYRMLNNHHDAEDITQETFLRAIKAIDGLRQEERLTSWLYAIASNLCLDQIRRRRRLWWIPLPEVDFELPLTSDDDVPFQVEQDDMVRRALNALAPKDALCLILRTYEGFSSTEVAAIMDCSESAVWSRLARARAAFSKAYDRVSRESEEE